MLQRMFGRRRETEEQNEKIDEDFVVVGELKKKINDYSHISEHVSMSIYLDEFAFVCFPKISET